MLAVLEDYLYIYNIVIVVLFLSALIVHYSRSDYSIKINNILAFIFLIFTALLWGFRSVSVGTDTVNYVYMFDRISAFPSYSALLSSNEFDLLFMSLIYFVSLIGDVHLFFLTISIGTSLIFYYYIKLISDNGVRFNTIILILLYASMFFFNNLYCNIIRNGLSIPILLVFSYYFKNRNYKNALGWGVGAVMCHVSAALPVALFVVIDLLPRVKIKYYYILYCIVGGLSAIGIGFQKILNGLNIVRIDKYIATEAEYTTGFRLDFFLFNTIFVVAFAILYSKNQFYEFYFKAYVLLSCIFFMWFHIAFSDRIGLYSWSLIPVLTLMGISNIAIEKNKIATVIILFCAFLAVSYILR